MASDGNIVGNMYGIVLGRGRIIRILKGDGWTLRGGFGVLGLMMVVGGLLLIGLVLIGVAVW